MKTLVCAAGIIDGTGSGYRANTALLVENQRILAVDNKQALLSQADEYLDLGDVTLIPGFVDAHTHITIRPGEGDQHGQLNFPPVWQALRGVRNLRRILESGVTTIRVMGEVAGIDVAFKRAVEQGELVGPRMRIATMALSATHGHGAALGVADGVEGVRRAVRDNLRNGADHIKLFVTGGVSSSGSELDTYHYSREEIRAIVQEAHRAGKRVAAHAHGGEGVTICAEEGVDSVEHGGLLTEDNIRVMAAKGTWLVLTNSIAFHPNGIEGGDAHSPEILQKLRQVRQTIDGTFQRIMAARLRFALGTDSMHGYFGHEIEWLVERGISPEAAIIAGTRHGAEVIGLDKELGTLEPGKVADFVALAGNPLEEIQVVHNVLAVAKEGNVLFKRATA
jgi:imidazolonepropionase-like amidohydrolase